jgi:hypothetical protein
VASPLRLPTVRAVIDARLRSGHRIRFRPDPSRARWLVDLWAIDGTAILAAEPLVITADLWEPYRARRSGFPAGPLRVEGLADPDDGPLADQAITLYESAAD